MDSKLFALFYTWDSGNSFIFGVNRSIKPQTMIRKYYDILLSEGGKGMSKEEILTKNLNLELDSAAGYSRDTVHLSMDFYARQESIGFAKWAAERFVYAWDDLWLTLDGSKKKHPTEYVWNLYLTSKQEG